MQADLIIYNGSCCFVEDGKAIDWVAAVGGKIAGAGSGDQWRQWDGPHTRRIDAGGRTVLPGFIDNHVHVIMTAQNLASVNLSQAESFRDIGRLLAEAAASGHRKHLRGIHLEVDQLAEKRPPNRMDIDRYCGSIPVSLHTADYQISVLNTCGMLHFKIPFTTPGTETDESGVPTGIFRRDANAVLYGNTLKGVGDRYRKKISSDIMNLLLANGITTIGAMEGGRMCDGMGSDADLEFLHRHQKEFPVDMELYYPTIDIERVLKMGLSHIGGVLYLDGTIGGRTAAISQDYSDGGSGNGMLCMDQEDVNEFVLNCYRERLQLSLFSLGDRAIDMALAAHEQAVEKTGITGLRHRLEHVVLCRPDQMKRAAALGMVFDMMPSYEGYWGGADKMYAQRLGQGYRRTNPLRQVMESGVILCGGSDSDVTEANPLLGIHWAVNHPVQEHRLTVFQALEMYTKNGALALKREQDKGTLEIGKDADIVILSGDILKTPSDQIREMKVMTTIKAGVILYER